MINFVFDWDPGRRLGIMQSSYLDNIREHFSVEDKQAMMAKYRTGNRWTNSRRYAITPAGRFAIGMFPDIIEHIKTLTFPYNLIITEKFREHFKPKYISNEDYVVEQLDLECRGYQNECVKHCLSHGNGIAVVATAGGKTLIMATLIYNILLNKKDKPKILLVTIPQLVKQTYDDFVEYGLNKHMSINMWDGDHPHNHDSDVTIASNTILMSKKQDLSSINDYDTLFVDECHKLRKGNAINKILNHVKTLNRYGFTGTLPSDKIDVWNIIAQTGPILFTKTSAELRDEKYIAQAEAIVLKINYDKIPQFKSKPSLSNPTGLYNEECDFLYANHYRNSVIGRLCGNIQGNTLILIDRLTHQQEIINSIQKHVPHKNVQFVRGEVEKTDREKIKDMMENENNVICVAIAKIFSTGINIKNIQNILFAMPGKAKIRILQSIGRGLRLHENKKMLTIIDLADNLHYGVQHLQDRLNLYEEEKIKYAIKEIYQNKK